MLMLHFHLNDVDFLLLMLKPMLMMLDMTLLIFLDTSDVVAYAVADDANGDAQMPNIARHLAGVYAMLFMPPLLPM